MLHLLFSTTCAIVKILLFKWVNIMMTVNFQSQPIQYLSTIHPKQISSATDGPISMLSFQLDARVSCFYCHETNMFIVFLHCWMIDMDCDGLKKDLLIDEDGTLFGQPSSVFSDSEHFWGEHRSFFLHVTK